MRKLITRAGLVVAILAPLTVAAQGLVVDLDQSEQAQSQTATVTSSQHGYWELRQGERLSVALERWAGMMGWSFHYDDSLEDRYLAHQTSFVGRIDDALFELLSSSSITRWQSMCASLIEGDQRLSIRRTCD